MGDYEKFKAHNLHKIDSLQECLTTQRWQAACAIPYLIHYNLPHFPGGKFDESPAGFRRSAFYDTMHRSACELFEDLAKDLPPPRKSAFLGLYAMGSVGSACFTSASDIDYWLIYPASALDARERSHTESRLRAIESWAMETASLEIHVYLHDLGEIQKATFSHDKEDAQEFGPILKEEFLRSATYIAGAEPAFWGDTTQETIDFAPIPRLTTRQYLASSLMLLDKALEKPFKASLKIALLRRLAARPNEKLPAEIYIDAVRAGESPDSYVVLLDYLWEHFHSIHCDEDLAFLKNTLYLKMVAEETSKERLKRNTERVVKARFQRVGPPIDFDSLNGFFNWPFEKRIQFSERIAQFIQTSLKEISEFPDAKFLDPGKIRALTKKIMLRRQTGRIIESLTFADVPSRGENSLTFVHDDAAGVWHLTLERFAGRADLEKLKPIKSAPSTIPLVAFALKNKLLNQQKTEVRSYPSNLFPTRLPEIIASIEGLLSVTPKASALEKDSAPDKHLIIMEQTNPNKLDSRQVTVLTRTTWGIVEYRVFAGENSLIDAINCVLRGSAPAAGSEFVGDTPTGPEPADLSDAIAKSYRDNPQLACLITEQARFILIRNHVSHTAASVFDLILTMGRAGGKYVFVKTPPGAIKSLVTELFKPTKRPTIRIYRIDQDRKHAFMLVDQNGQSHAWECWDVDAQFSLMTNIDFARFLYPGIPIESFIIEYKKGMKDPWAFSPFVPDVKRSLNPAHQIQFEFLDGKLATVVLGEQKIENQAVPTALQLIARFVDTNRVGKQYYPAYLSTIRFPDALAKRLGLADALRMKHELELRIDNLRQH